MKKYIKIFTSNWQVDLEYRLNFILGRIQSVILLFSFYFLWTTIFTDQKILFGYSYQQMFTYVVLSHIVRNIIFNTKIKFVGSEIHEGYLSTVLLKPIDYFWQSFTEDIAKRSINIISSIMEVCVFILIIHPLDIYPTALQLVMTTVIPVGVMIAFPVKALLGSLHYSLVLYACILSMVLLAGCVQFWKWAVRHYQSASS